MSTFFSGTDTNTLKEEGIDRNHFVSLIVNNEGTYTAAITRKVKLKRDITEAISYPTFEDKEVKSHKVYSEEVEKIEWFHLDIEIEGYTSLYNKLKGRIAEIKAAKENKPKENFGYYDWNKDKALLPKQQSLFFDSHIGKVSSGELSQDDNLPFGTDYLGNKIPNNDVYDLMEFNKETIKSIVLQLLTGSIIIPNASKIDAKKWAQNMTPLYEKRFGKGEDGMKLFRTWADGYIEFLCWFSQDINLVDMGLNDDEMASICAYSIIKELDKLPSNKYIKVYINILNGYIK